MSHKAFFSLVFFLLFLRFLIMAYVENPYFAHAVEWLAPHLREKSSVSVCNVGPPLQESTIPADLLCAVPNADFQSGSEKCTVLYSDLRGLNAYETARQVEANVLRVPKGKLLLQKSNQVSVHVSLVRSSRPSCFV